MKELNVGFIGLGHRGLDLMKATIKLFENVHIVAVCDGFADRAEDAKNLVVEKGATEPVTYTNYKDLLADENVQAVIISASWEDHVPLAIASMKAGKITGLEVGGAYSIRDCYRLVDAYEETKTPFMFLENCCYGDEELMIDNMVRKGVFGEVVHCHGAYDHELGYEICGGLTSRHYRLRNYMLRNCDNYPTHNLGPLAKILNINRGNRIVALSSFSSKAVGLEEYVKGKEEFAELRGKKFMQGDVVSTNLMCADGSLITLKLSTTLIHPYSREFTVSGTKAFFSHDAQVLVTPKNDKGINYDMTEYMNSVNEYKEEYTPKCLSKLTKEEIEAGHGGIDARTLREFYKHAISGEEMPIDVYDAAVWMAVTCLTEDSIAKGGAVVEMPDFTCGKWVMREPKGVMDYDAEN